MSPFDPWEYEEGDLLEGEGSMDGAHRQITNRLLDEDNEPWYAYRWVIVQADNTFHRVGGNTRAASEEDMIEQTGEVIRND